MYIYLHTTDENSCTTAHNIIFNIMLSLPIKSEVVTMGYSL